MLIFLIICAHLLSFMHIIIRVFIFFKHNLYVFLQMPNKDFTITTVVVLHYQEPVFIQKGYQPVRKYRSSEPAMKKSLPYLRQTSHGISSLWDFAVYFGIEINPT